MHNFEAKLNDLSNGQVGSECAKRFSLICALCTLHLTVVVAMAAATAAAKVNRISVLSSMEKHATKTHISNCILANKIFCILSFVFYHKSLCEYELDKCLLRCHGCQCLPGKRRCACLNARSLVFPHYYRCWQGRASSACFTRFSPVSPLSTTKRHGRQWSVTISFWSAKCLLPISGVCSRNEWTTALR